MIKTIDEITIVGIDKIFMLKNAKNKSYFKFNGESGRASFKDSIGNTIQNHPSKFRIKSELFHLTEIGQIIKTNNGNAISYLSNNDLLELAQNTFYEEGQTRFYDFINQSFTIDLSK